MNGIGRVTVDDETREVYPGDVIFNRIGGSHGIYNHTDEPMELFAVAVCMERGSVDGTDLNDDLSGRS